LRGHAPEPPRENEALKKRKKEREGRKEERKK
jgi:hypothetical protein